MTAVTKNILIMPPAKIAAQALPLLDFLAGEHAHAIAYLWPKPHLEFYTLPAARRHLTGMIVSGATVDVWTGDRAVAKQIERAKNADLAKLVSRDQLPGLMKALAKCGEQLWKGEDYRHFLDLFKTPSGARFLRHVKNIRPDCFGPAVELPEVLRVPKIAGVITTVTAARNLAEAYALISDRGEALVTVERWSRAQDRSALFKMAANDLTPLDFKRVGPAPVLPHPFEAVTNRKDLNAIALEFMNCLRDYVADIAAGNMAIYVWRGTPKAVLALRSDAIGWRLAEVCGLDNEDVPEEPLREIAAAVTKAGARTGRALSVLTGWLENYADGENNDERPVATFRDDLHLGDIWN